MQNDGCRKPIAAQNKFKIVFYKIGELYKKKNQVEKLGSFCSP